jgi:hypothetical protein
MDLPPTIDPPGASASGVESAQVRRLAAGRAINREFCAIGAARVRWVGQLVADVRDEVRQRVLGLGDTELDVDAEEFAHRMCVDTVMGALGVGTYEAARLVNLSDRLAVLPEVGTPGRPASWTPPGCLPGAGAGVGDGGAGRLHRPSRRARAHRHGWRGPVASAGPTPGAHPGGGSRRVRSWSEGDGLAVLAVHADKSEIAMADQVITDLARAWPATDGDGVRLSMDQRRADALMGLFRAVRDHSLADAPAPRTAAGSAFTPAVEPGTRLPRVAVRRVHDLGLVLHADTLFADGPAVDATGQQRGLGRPDADDPDSARTLARKQLRDGTGVQVLVVDDTGAVEHVVRLDRDTAEYCRSREALVAAVREQLATAPPLEVDTHDPSEAIARHVRAAAPTCSFYDCPRQARSCDLDREDEPVPLPLAMTPRGREARRRSPISIPRAGATTTPRPSAPSARD